MAIEGAQLADGQLAAAEAVMYTCPVGKRAFIKSIVCNNTSGANTNITELWLRPSGGTSRRIARVSLSPNETLYFDDPTTMDASDTIRGAATNANEVDYIVSGAEETV